MTLNKKRRTQEERSAATRKSLLEAAVAELHIHGYGATSTVMITKRAGLTRGALAHQFPTKADLMVFVVEEVFRQELTQYAKFLKHIDDPEERLLAYPEVLWKVLSKPSGVAVLEVFQGSRSDPVLAGMLRPVQARIEREAFRNVEEKLGFVPPAAFLRLLIWSVRGLSIANALTSNSKEAREAIGMFRAMTAASLSAGIIALPRQG